MGQFDLSKERNVKYGLKGSRGQGTTVTGKMNMIGAAEKLDRRKSAYNLNRSSAVKASDDMLQGMDKLGKKK